MLGPEMRSTGEVMGLDRTFYGAFLKAQLGAGVNLPDAGRVFISVKNGDKTPRLLGTAEIFAELGFGVVATRGTASFLEANGIACETVNKVYEGRPNIVDSMKNGDISLVLNTSGDKQSIGDSREIRMVAIADGIPYCTTAAASHVVAMALKTKLGGDFRVQAIQDLNGPFTRST